MKKVKTTIERTIWETEENGDSSLFLEDEKTNLDITTPSAIICIADLGLWDGRKSAYRILSNNLADIFNVIQGDYIRFYCDRYNVRCNDTHHDGTNRYLFRMLKTDVDGFESLFHHILNGTITSNLISKYTTSIRPLVAKVYGW